jgi:hypothetical protein
LRDKTKVAFIAHKWNATNRGVEFNFTYQEWVRWWKRQLGPDWLKKRGCKSGQYVMARYYDDGPYAAYNVKCALAENNMKEAWFNKGRGKGRPSGRAKLTEVQVRDIYLRSKDKRRGIIKLARQYNVNVVTIKAIKRKRSWRHITDLLDFKTS